MKKVMPLVLLIVLVGGCSTHRQMSRTATAGTTDSSTYRAQMLSATRADSLRAEVNKRVRERASTETTTIERGSNVVEPFTITAAFTLDTSAKGDTLRLVSQENDQVAFQVFYDKKSGQAVAQVQGKGRSKTTPFEKITITNATVTKNTDSAATLKAASGSTAHAATYDSSIGRAAHQTIKESSELVRKQTGISRIVLGIFGVLAALCVLLIIFRKKIFPVL